MAERAIHLRIAVKDLEAARARLASLGVEGEEALSKIERGAPRASAGLEQVDRAALRAGRNIRFALGNAAAQIQDVVVSLQAGQQPLTVLIQQGSQLASAFGPVGVILGTVGALATAAAAAFFGLQNNTDDASDAADRAAKEYEQLQTIMEELQGTAEVTGEALAAAARNLVGKAAIEVTALETRIREAHAQAEALRQTADPETAFIAQAENLKELEEALDAAREKWTLARAAAGEFAGEAAAAGQAAEKLGEGAVLSAKERAEAEKEAAAALKRTGQQYEELAGIARTFIRQANQDRFQAAQRAEREAEQRAKTIADMAVEADQTRRLAAAKQESEQAYREVEIAIAGENAARKLGTEASEEQRQAVAAEAAETKRLQFVIQETDQARRHSAQLIANIVRENERFFETLERGEASGQRAAAAEAKRTRERLAEEAARELQRPFDTAANNIQNTMTGVFETIYSGGVTSFKDIAEAATQIFTRLAAELTTLLILRPQLLMGGGVGGAGTSLASQLGFAGAGAVVANPAAGTPTSTPVTGPGGLLVGGGVTSSSGAPAAPGFFSATMLQAGLAGVGVGTVAGGLIGGSQVGSLVGSTAGAIAGGAIGSAIPIIGTAIGAFAGGALGGLIGGFFGGGNGSPGAANNTGRLSFGTLAGSGGPFGRVAIGGDTDFVSALAPMIQQFDEGVAQFLTTRQEDAVGQALQALEEFTGRFPEADPSKAFQAIIEQRTRTILQSGFPGISAEAVLEGNTGVEDIASRLQTALETQRQIEALTQASGPGATLRRELEAIGEQFDELRANAEEYGISIDGLAAAENRAIQAAKDAIKDPIRQQILELTLGQTPAGRLELELKRIEKSFNELTKNAEALGISTKGLAEAEEQAIEAAKELAAEEAKLQRQRREQAREERQALALSIPGRFDALSDPLEALRTQIRFENKNPTQQFEAARKDFERLVRQAEKGNLEAIAALPGAAELFRSLAGRFGASPLQAQVDKQILSAISDVLGTVEDAQREASRGMVGAINRASNAQIDTLKELIAETREVKREIRRLGRESRVA